MSGKNRKKRKNRHGGLILVALVVGIMIVVIGVRCAALQKTLDSSKSRETELQASLDDEKQRSKDIEEYGKYTKTKKFYEEVAEEKLGLVHDGETIFKNGDSSK